ncbi:beta strand repeat-containing protein [Paracidobacterium acidisoli]|uniref:beta strand repeat-containing protein n=1 Tax=Paracidobacterium acidisoli TaxID=2303751 RepID=UPI0018F242B5|nr:IPT/TIG domain-containing protein [Paracidobacterium acidisoli]MBT9333263.1 transcription factor [Paracidobacterium acidisoli]
MPFFVSFALGFGFSLLISGCGGGGSGSGGSGNAGGGGGTTTSTLAVTSISPASVTAGVSALTLTVNGSGFVSSSVVQVGGTSETTTYVSASQLTATVPASQITQGAQLAVSVANGTVSSSGTPINLEVDNPAPTITTISPTSETTGTTSAVVVVTGTGFDPATTINVNGTPRATTFSSATQAGVTLTSADLAAAGSLSLTAVNPTPGGGTSAAESLSVAAATLPGPKISSVSPNSIYTGSPDTTITVTGTGFILGSVVEWNGTPLKTTLFTSYTTFLVATVPAADLTAAGNASVTVMTPGASPSTSSAVSVAIANPPAPALTGLYPNAGPIGTTSQITVEGTNFVPSTTVSVNGTVVASTLNNPTSITATIPASSLAFPGNVNVTVTTPAPGGGTSSAQPFTVYLPITANDIVFNATDGLLYASVPATSAGVSGNSVVGIDPTTGNVTRQIQVGSNPNKLALSSDGTQLFVGLDGAASVAQVNLTQGKVVNQFQVGVEGLYNPPAALFLVAVPGLPNSVAVATAAGITIYDSGVARADEWTSGEGAMSFGSSGSTLYVLSDNNTVEELTVGSTGITAASALSGLTQYANWLQYDKGNLYLSTGQVLNASNGTLEGTFYSSLSTPATGPVVSDSSLGRAFVATGSFGNNSNTVLAFDESSFNLLGGVVVNGAGENGYGASFEKIVRWGQNGLALNASPGPFTSQSQLFIFQSPLVKDLSSSPADLSVTLSAPGTATTGSSVSWVATVKNLGPNASDGAVVGITLDPSLTIGSVKASTGSCGSGTTFSCDPGTLASGASATITVNATPTEAGTLAGTASVTSVSYDPTPGNDTSATSTTVTGGIYGAVPSISSISPNLVQAGSSDFTLTVSGNGFNANSTVNLGVTALTTTFVNAAQLTATVTAAEIANYGWAAVTVSNPTPGGGVSQITPLTIYDLVNVPTSGLLFDPYAQSLYATVPSTAISITGNSVVKINPATGAVGTPVAVGSQPTVMAETTDGDYLYIGLSGSNSLAKFNLLNQSLTATIPLSLTQSGSTSNVTATSLVAMPGSDTTLAVGITNAWSSFGILDTSGTTGTFRPNLSGIYEGANPVFADASHLYASGGESTVFYRYSVNANGLTETDGTTLQGMSGFGGGIQLANGLVYGLGGGIINPSTSPPSQIAALPLIDFYDSGSTPEGSGFAADPSLSKEFLMLDNLAGTSAFGLTRYDLSTYLPEAVLQMPASYSSITSGWNMLRWGQDGLALLTSTENYTTNQTITSLILLRGPFVAPQELGTDTAASLTASSATSIAHGSGNTMLTLTGTNFLPGVAVTWNGSYRTTTIVDATHVTVAIPASDLANAGSASLIATNPGAPASGKLTITIN